MFYVTLDWFGTVSKDDGDRGRGAEIARAGSPKHARRLLIDTDLH